MNVKLPHPPDPSSLARMATAEIRGRFLIEPLFESGSVSLFHTEVDRAVVGGAVPSGGPLPLAAPPELAADYFTQRRELGVVNIGAPGVVRVDGTEYRLESRDVLYIGRGCRSIEFEGTNHAEPPVFYFVSYPAHASHPTRFVAGTDVESASFGSAAAANRRTINKYIRPPVVETCQLTMGITDLEEGSVWNTMPAHRHPRRSEIYMYYDLAPDALVLHCLGEPDQTRHVVVRNRQAVVSPGWSIHCGAGTARYSFVWAMGGENREFSDMDGFPLETFA